MRALAQSDLYTGLYAYARAITYESSPIQGAPCARVGVGVCPRLWVCVRGYVRVRVRVRVRVLVPVRMRVRVCV